MDKETRGHISLIAFFAWIGLGADGLSSSAYGPEQAFLALKHHIYLGLYLVVATALTVFIISLSYNQVIELFPSGGGGYKVTSRLVGPHAGLVSGAALILNYVLTIAVSFASAIAALFSLLPVGAQPYKIYAAVGMVLLLMFLNLRGMKESIKVFMPIFLGFVITHLVIIIYGVVKHGRMLGAVYYHTVHTTFHLASTVGWFFIIALFLRAYSLGGGTYTGLEAVSNNVNNLKEPRVKTGKWTMFYMAVSLSFTAGGIILLYLLWGVHPIVGKTLNAVAFGKIFQTVPYGHFFLMLILVLEAGLLFVGANTGFLGGPAVLANMAIDGWVPRRYRGLSNRLVVQNGIVLFGILAVLVLIWTHGSIKKLVVLYSMNVFITFSLSLFGLSVYWWRRRKREPKWLVRLPLSFIGFIVCSLILCVTVVERFTQGGWLTILMTSAVAFVCLLIKNHYKKAKKQIRKLDEMFTFPVSPPAMATRKINPAAPTAVFFIGNSIGEGVHTLLWAQRMFPWHFQNFVFVSVGVVDVNTYESDRALAKMQIKVEKNLKYFMDYAHQHGIPSKSYSDYGTDHVKKLVELAETVKEEFKNPVFFAARVILKNENWLTRLLHNETPVSLQRYLHLRGMQMIILPVILGR